MTIDVRTPQGHALTASDRSQVISDALRQMARVSRFADTKAITRAPIAVGRRRDYVTPILFLVLFVLPVLAGIAYYGFIASDRFITEARFAIRPALGGVEKTTTTVKADEKAAPDPIGPTLDTTQASILQNTLITMEYIHSRPMIEALERDGMPVREMFSRGSIDRPNRFNPAKPIEKFLRYWHERVEVGVEQHSGVVTLHVNAFTPEESLALTRAVIAEAERMINEVSVRARASSLGEMTRELGRAEERVDKLRVAMRDLRNKEGMIDAQRSADATMKMLGELRDKRVSLLVRQMTLGHDLAPTARAMQELQTNIKQLDETIAGIEQASASASPQERRLLSATLGSFEVLETELRNAERYHSYVKATQERAKILADRQLVFFNPVVEPILPTSSQAPRRLLSILSVIAGSGTLLFAGLLARKVAG